MMRKFFTVFALITLVNLASVLRSEAQIFRHNFFALPGYFLNGEDEYWPDKMPVYPGGEAKMAEFVRKSLVYPVLETKKVKDGTVVVEFTVSESGKIIGKKIVKSLGFEYDREVLQMVDRMPDWEPGSKRGKPVAVKLTLPVRFMFPAIHSS